MEFTLDDLIGKRVLVGLTWVKSEQVVRQYQYFGMILGMGEDGIEIRREDSLGEPNEIITLPPDPSAFRTAPRGNYKLNCSGDTIENPDLLSTWTIQVNENEDCSDRAAGFATPQ